MPLIVEKADEWTDREEASERPATGSTARDEDRPLHTRRRIDVTDLPTAEIGEYVHTNLETDAVSLEHRGGRTYLLVEE